ncbi:MAG: hypothetical protein DPW11_00085 [bacterium]|nr:hypothetical protein [bacterium]
MASSGMRVNLLKNHRVLSEKDYLREKKFLQAAVVGLVLVVFVTVAMALWNFVLSQKLRGIEEEIAKASSQMQGLTEANAGQVYVKNRLGLIGNFLDDQAIARESLQEVLTLSLPGVTIGGMSFESASEISVTVSAESQPALKEALAYYRRTDGFFPQVVSNGISRSKEGRYEMKLVLTLPLKDEKS